jgi:hypothetical protein
MGVSSRWRMPSWQDSGRMTSTWRTGLRTPCACIRSRAAEMPSAVAGDRPGDTMPAVVLCGGPAAIGLLHSTG